MGLGVCVGVGVGFGVGRGRRRGRGWRLLFLCCCFRCCNSQKSQFTVCRSINCLKIDCRVPDIIWNGQPFGTMDKSMEREQKIGHFW